MRAGGIAIGESPGGQRRAAGRGGGTPDRSVGSGPYRNVGKWAISLGDSMAVARRCFPDFLERRALAARETVREAHDPHGGPVALGPMFFDRIGRHDAVRCGLWLVPRLRRLVVAMWLATGCAPGGRAIRLRSVSVAGVRWYALCVACSFGVFAACVHLAPHVLDHGVKPAAAVMLLGAIGVGSTEIALA
ncbi:hypothetical protein WS72_02495 [Burkholderia savannae]|uniref:Uncharacterized protein n=1 Tax=Burkholderia savannae TaxID=1637837 RepID=A0ABR5TBB4_9BURK|nr:hypothetical protein WS72_02495 [Burkholderia savannae]